MKVLPPDRLLLFSAQRFRNVEVTFNSPEVASVDRKSEASHVEAARNVKCRGLSITRLEGGRWRLRRTRWAMEKVRRSGLMWSGNWGRRMRKAGFGLHKAGFGGWMVRGDDEIEGIIVGTAD